MAESSTPVEIFCSYAYEDQMWLRKLENHLSPLRRQGLVSFWHNRLITPGTDWARDIDTHLETASIILLLVSADFFASDYCYGVEMKRALERHQRGEAQVIPILARPVDWRYAPFAHLRVLPTNIWPLSTWMNEDAALADVADNLRRVLEGEPLPEQWIQPLFDLGPRYVSDRHIQVVFEKYPRYPFLNFSIINITKPHHRINFKRPAQTGQILQIRFVLVDDKEEEL